MTQRLALVTGGASGIGAAIAQRLHADGHTVLIADLTPAKIAEFHARTGIEGVVCDVSNYQDVERAVGEIEARCAPIDIVVNNAGITRDAMVHKMTPVQWDQLIAVNLTSSFNTTRCIVPGMRQRRWGRIISISSMTAQRGQVGQANYAAAKAGLIGFTKTIALELAGLGITANCIAPGFIITEMTAAMPPEVLQAEAERIPAKRLGQPAEIAAAASYLASDGAAFVTGQVLAVNGGQYL
jgi:acetoacetyl-CoA reductase